MSAIISVRSIAQEKSSLVQKNLRMHKIEKSKIQEVQSEFKKLIVMTMIINLHINSYAVMNILGLKQVNKI